MIPLVSERTINIIFNLEHNILAIFCQSDELTGHWRLHPLGLESYWYIHESPLTITLFSSFQFIQQGQYRLCFIFWSCTRILGTIFTYTFLMYKPHQNHANWLLFIFSTTASFCSSIGDRCIPNFKLFRYLHLFCVLGSNEFWITVNILFVQKSCRTLRWIRHCWSPQTSVNILWVLVAILLCLAKNMMLKHTLKFYHIFQQRQ